MLLCRVGMVCAVAAVCVVGSSAQTPTLTLEPLLARTALYIGKFIEQFSNVVAEEKYVQDTLGNLPIIMPGRGGLSSAGSPPSRHREIKSDFLLVKVGPAEWLPFRDVYEVDGTAVRDREGRLQKLFLQQSPDALEQAKQISVESSRYNLGAMQRTINTPILSLVFLQGDTQGRFRFKLDKRDPSVGDDVWIVTFEEQARPTLVRGLRDSDIPSKGKYWIDVTGRVARTELNLESPGVRARLTTSFRRDEKFQIDVPFEMHEQYYLDRGQVSATATYSKFRRFDVTSDEIFKSPDAAPAVLVTEKRSGLTLMEIGSGRFTMGSPAGEAGRRDDETTHDVTINRPFFLGQHEVTQQEWRAVMGTNPSRFGDCGPRCPVENVTFADVQQFLSALNQQAGNELVYRLPTESEWEYACRAGAVTPFSGGELLTTAAANVNGRVPYGKSPAGLFRERPTRVSGFSANAWGISDMHGNVREWTSDWYGAYPEDDVDDPAGAPSGDRRVVRGGSWQTSAAAARCAARSSEDPKTRDSSLGFRVAADRR